METVSKGKRGREGGREIGRQAGKKIEKELRIRIKPQSTNRT